MRHLKTFIENENKMAALFGHKPAIDINKIDQATATRLYSMLDANLSPENLTCDGELKPAQVRKRAILFRGAIADLDSQGFVRPQMYCI